MTDASGLDPVPTAKLERRQWPRRGARLARFGGGENTFDDLVVARAAAQVAHHPGFDLVFAWPRLLGQQRRGGDELSGVQIPHWNPPWRMNASCSGARCSSSGARPSTVVMALPSAINAGSKHADSSSPSTSTEQAPQTPTLQPSFVPVIPRSSRSSAQKAVGRDGDGIRRAIHGHLKGMFTHDASTL